jgi:hypothetical protein
MSFAERDDDRPRSVRYGGLDLEATVGGQGPHRCRESMKLR